MHKFPLLKDGVNEKLLKEVRSKVDRWLDELFDEGDLTRVDDLTQFTFGSATIQVMVNPWHSEDVLVKVFSYLAENVDGKRAAVDFMRLNAELPLGAFSLVFDNTVMLSCSIPGANLDRSELLGALQTVAVYADQYDDIIDEYYRGGN
ncbi:MAG: YbjN domain-containing protein [Aminobacteriaceae bacterium]